MGLFAPALIVGGLAAIVAGSGVCPSLAAEAPVAALIMGGGSFGAGCGLLGILGFYYWHRDLVDGQRDDDKTPLEYGET